MCATLLLSRPALAQFTQQGLKLVGTGAIGGGSPTEQGGAVSLSADGNTAIVGTVTGSGNGAWVWTRTGGVWTQQGAKLVGSGGVGANAFQGHSVSLSADGNTAMVGGPVDNANAGAAWVWTRSGGVWTQQGTKLVASGAVGKANQGQSVSLSADGNTAIVGGYGDNGGAGAAWVWTRSEGVWTQQGTKLVGSGAVGNALQGTSVSLSADGNTAIVGGSSDGFDGNSYSGAAWVWTRSGGVWIQQGTKLVGSGGGGGDAFQGLSVSLSADGNTVIVGGYADNNNAGAAWIWTRSGGVWTQQGTKLVGSGNVGSAWQGYGVALAGDGNMALIGGKGDSGFAGAAWVWTRSGGVWTQQGTKLVGSGAVGNAYQGHAVSLAADGNTAIVGAPADNGMAGAAWIFAASVHSPTTLTSAWVDGRVRLSWVDASTDETGFKIERRDDPSGTYAQEVTVARNVNFYTDTASVGTASYCYRVRATNAAGDSAYSNESCIAGTGTGTLGQKLQFTGASYSVPGTPADSTVTITRTGGSSGSISATLLVSGGSAALGVDYYVLTNGTVTFAPGETSKVVTAIHVLANNPPNSRTVNLVLSHPSGEVTLGSPSSATLTIQGAPVGSPGTIGIFDTACVEINSHSSCTGEYLKPAGYPVGDTATLEKMNIQRVGAVTDGVTLLLLRVRSATPVTFSLKLSNADAPSEYGTLTWRDGTHAGSSVTVNPEATPSAGLTAYALYRAPADLPAAAALQVTATNGAGPSPPVAILLKLPPVVLVHGVWSGPSAFADPERLAESLYAYLVNQGLYVVSAAYSDDPAGSFDPGHYSTPILALTEATDAGLRKARANDIAASQVDVVAHSMGGLVARARATGILPSYQGLTLTKDLVPYSRPENRFKGEFHKLITVGTPHRGTPAATWFVEHKCEPAFSIGSDTLEVFFREHLDKPLDDAIYQFQPASPVLRSLGAATVLTHTIAGRTPHDPTSTEGNLNFVVSGNFRTASIDTILNVVREHDTIVPVVSQIAGRTLTTNPAGKSWSYLDEAVHADATILKTDRGRAETTNQTLFPWVATLLRGPVKDYFEVVQQTTIGGLPIDKTPCPVSIRAGVRSALPAGAVTLTPDAGTIVRPGDSIQIALTVPDDGITTQALISIRSGMSIVGGSGGVFSTSYTIPADAAGDLLILANTARAGGTYYAASTYVTVLPAVPPDALTASPNSVSMTVPGATSQLVVNGSYADGSIITLTSPEAGTTYATESGTNAVISVTAGGLVEAQGNGEDTVIVRNGLLVAAVTVTVSITNHRPSLGALADRAIHPGNSVDVALAAIDPDGDLLHLNGNGLPGFATVVDNLNGTGVLQLRPATSDVGSYVIVVGVTDEGTPPLGVSQSFQLTVNIPPTIAPQPQNQTIKSGQTATLSIGAAGTAPLTYQWYAGISGTTTNPIGGNSNGYTTPSLTSTTSYWVRVSNSAGTSDSNTATITVTAYQPFTDDTLTAGLSVIRAVHITEMRARIDTLRAGRGLSPFAWTGPALSAGVSTIRAQHIFDLRTALSEIYSAAGLQPPVYTDSTLGAGTPMKVAHIAEIRAAIIARE